MHLVNLSNRLSVADYDRERQLIRETYGDSSAEAGAKRDQALAKLFWHSGWTQEDLAKKEAKTQQWVSYRLRFGRFLENTTAVVNPESLPKNLSEGRFRSYWERGDKTERNERIRFAAVLKLIQEDIALRHNQRPSIGKAIVEKFADGKWHKLETIAAGLDVDEDHVIGTFANMEKPGGSFGARCEHKRAGGSSSYRIFKLARTISSSELNTKLAPIIADLIAEGKKNMATMSPGTVARLATLLKRQIDEWCE